mmetsp:Transcript_40688/g.96749  ORF Transcript_40688/g.96749 Transcript_40688/m.96749 type:complete len:321 (+) Transcript_40688:3-965(+)
MHACRCTHCSAGIASIARTTASTSPAEAAARAPSGFRSARPATRPSACSQLPGAPALQTSRAASSAPAAMIRPLFASLLASWRRADIAVRATGSLPGCARMVARRSSAPPEPTATLQASSVTATRRRALQAPATTGAAEDPAPRRTPSRASGPPLRHISRAVLKAPEVMQGRSSSARVMLRSVLHAAASAPGSEPLSRRTARMRSSPPSRTKAALLSSFLKQAWAAARSALSATSVFKQALSVSATTQTPWHLLNASRVRRVTKRFARTCRHRSCTGSCPSPLDLNAETTCSTTVLLSARDRACALKSSPLLVSVKISWN